MPLVFTERPKCLSASEADQVAAEIRKNLTEGTPNLIDPRFDQDSCGVGFVCSALAKASHGILEDALTALARLEHRGAVAV
jgi:glutamate synthase (NADPH/NADH) large chain